MRRGIWICALVITMAFSAANTHARSVTEGEMCVVSSLSGGCAPAFASKDMLNAWRVMNEGPAKDRRFEALHRAGEALCIPDNEKTKQKFIVVDTCWTG